MFPPCRHFWHRKGDVFHLLLGIALALDNRVWPEEDEEAVEGLVSLVHHVTGVLLRPLLPSKLHCCSATDAMAAASFACVHHSSPE
jgi:hypothetical protein